jgi:hypothetical protein
VLNPGYDPEFDDVTECRTELVIFDEAAENHGAGTTPGLLRPGRPRPDPDRHARLRPATRRYPQLYSRIGFAHQYQPLDPDDIPTVLAQYWDQLGLPFDPANFDHAETANAVTQITGGNFRLIERLMTQIARVMSINQLDTITPDAVHAARQILVIGSQ